MSPSYGWAPQGDTEHSGIWEVLLWYHHITILVKWGFNILFTHGSTNNGGVHCQGAWRFVLGWFLFKSKKGTIVKFPTEKSFKAPGVVGRNCLIEPTGTKKKKERRRKAMKGEKRRSGVCIWWVARSRRRIIPRRDRYWNGEKSGALRTRSDAPRTYSGVQKRRPGLLRTEII